MPSKKALEKALQKEKELLALEEKMKEDANWEIGTNKKEFDRENKKNEKHSEKMKRQNEMKNLLLIEEETLSTNYGNRPKTRRNKNDDVYILNQALENTPITRAEKISLQKKQEKDARKFQQLKLEKEKEDKLQKAIEEENFYKKKNIIQNTKLMIDVNNNDLFEEHSIYATGIDNAINILSNDNKLDNIKLSFEEFYKEKLPIIKEQIPGLRLSQYQDKIKKLWKSSIENPMNNFN